MALPAYNPYPVHRFVTAGVAELLDSFGGVTYGSITMLNTGTAALWFTLNAADATPLVAADAMGQAQLPSGVPISLKGTFINIRYIAAVAGQGLQITLVPNQDGV